MSQPAGASKPLKDQKRRSPGRPLQSFRAHGTRMRDLVWILPGLGLPIAALMIGSLQIYYGYTQNNEPVIWAVAAAILLIPFGILSVRRYRQAGRGVTVHANGLRFLRTPSAPGFVFWEQIASIRTAGSRTLLFGATLSNRQVVMLRLQDEREIRIDGSLERLDELAEIIRDQIRPHIAARLDQAGAGGASIPFGPIAIESSGLKIKKHNLPWHSLESIQIDSGLLVIQSKDRRLKIPVADIPNLDHLLALAAERTKADQT